MKLMFWTWISIYPKYDPSKDLDYDDEFLDDVSEWLTSHYDFCHDGFDIVTK